MPSAGLSPAGRLGVPGGLVLLLVAGRASAATYYVDQGHPAARDDNAGSEASPWLTIQKGCATATAADVVIVKGNADGSETFYHPSRAGIADGRFNPALLANPGATVKVQPGHRVTLTYAADEFGRGPLLKVGDGNTWDGFKILETGKNFASDTGPVVMSGAGGKLLNMEIAGDWPCETLTPTECAAVSSCASYPCSTSSGTHDNHSGLRIESASDVTLRNTVIHGYPSSLPGIVASYGAHAGIKTYALAGITVENCEFYDLDQGINWKDSVSNAVTRLSSFHDLGTAISCTGNANDTGPIEVSQNLFKDVVAVFVPGSNPSVASYRLYNNTVFNTAPSPDRLWGWTVGSPPSYFWNNVVKDFGQTINGEWYEYDLAVMLRLWDHNCYFDSGSGVRFFGNRDLAAWRSICASAGASCDVDSVEADPLFVDEERSDFRLQAGSPCLAGVDLQDHDGDGDTAEPIPMGCFITGSECIGLPRDCGPAAPKASPPANLVVR